MDSAMVRQKKMALPSPKRVRDGRNLNLQALAITLAVSSRLKGDSTETQMIALAQLLLELVSCVLMLVITLMVAVGSDQGR